jgi:hypothetical protein
MAAAAVSTTQTLADGSSPTYFPLGSIAILNALFTDVNGAPADPTTVSFFYVLPEGLSAGELSAAVLVSPTKLAVGSYQVQLQLSTSGPWLSAWVGSGAFVAVSPDTLLNVAVSVLHS